MIIKCKHALFLQCCVRKLAEKTKNPINKGEIYVACMHKPACQNMAAMAIANYAGKVG